MRRLIVATQNPGKAKEIRRLLANEASVETLAEHLEIVLPPEDASTFEGNAVIKAEHVMKRLGVPVLADDSGLVVDALDGAPGVRSARYAPGTDADRVAKLLDALKDVPEARRTARFVCAMALACPGETPVVREGKCEGRITDAPRGSGGFGYDPVFLLEDGRTMAELDPEEKNRISHRGRALAAMLPAIREALHRTSD